jgi:2-haloacid dehalogenase
VRWDRRRFIRLAGAGAAASTLPRPTFAATAARRIRAIAFDAFPVFDPRPVFGLAETLFPGRGAELSQLWRTRQFEYQWLRALSGQYEDFWRTTEDALVFAAKQLRLDLAAEMRAQLMQAYLRLEAWPEAPAALRALRSADIRLAFLSNMTGRLLEAGIANSGLEGIFEHVLSTDRIRAYKPDPRAYQMAVEAFRLAREEILFVAFAGWDVAGAKWFGYPTFWANRSAGPAEELGTSPDATGKDLKDLVSFVKERSS